MLPALCAIRRTDPTATDALIASVADRAKATRLRLAGVLQQDVNRPGRRRYDMDLIDLTTGRIIRISEDRGNLARGCRMDTHALTEAAAMVENAIRFKRPDLVILNKFAKAEEEGGGMRDAIAAALSAEIPVLLGVGIPAIPALQLFAGDFCTIIDAEESGLTVWLSAHFGQRMGRDIVLPANGSKTFSLKTDDNGGDIRNRNTF